MSDFDDDQFPDGPADDEERDLEETGIEDSDLGDAEIDDDPADVAAVNHDGARSQQAKQRAVQAAQRRAVVKTLQVLDADAETVAATARLLGVSDPKDQVTLVLAVLRARSSDLQPVRDVLLVADKGDPFEAVNAAIVLADNPSRFRAAWDVLASVADLGRAPGVPAKAGTEFARAALRLTAADRDRLVLPEKLIG